MTGVPIPAELVRLHVGYTVWASERLLDAAAGLSPDELTRDFGTSEGSVLNTLAHIFAADRTWLARVRNEPNPDFITQTDRELAVLRREWPLLLERWRQWASELTDAQAQSVLFYRDLRGHLWEQPLWQVLLHVVNHATHHRGQVAGFLRAMGRVPPRTDLVVYYRDLAQPSA